CFESREKCVGNERVIGGYCRGAVDPPEGIKSVGLAGKLARIGAGVPRIGGNVGDGGNCFKGDFGERHLPKRSCIAVKTSRGNNGGGPTQLSGTKPSKIIWSA